MQTMHAEDERPTDETDETDEPDETNETGQPRLFWPPRPFEMFNRSDRKDVERVMRCDKYMKRNVYTHKEAYLYIKKRHVYIYEILCVLDLF